jgi:ArsR family transcriptional regulator
MNAPLHQFKAEFFKCLAHPVRIRILELLRAGEVTVGDLQARLEIDPSSVSQQLAVLRAREIVQTRKVGTSVYYRVRDERIYRILDAAREIFESRVHGLVDLLEAQRVEDGALASVRAPDAHDLRDASPMRASDRSTLRPVAR